MQITLIAFTCCPCMLTGAARQFSAVNQPKYDDEVCLEPAAATWELQNCVLYLNEDNMQLLTYTDVAEAGGRFAPSSSKGCAATRGIMAVTLSRYGISNPMYEHDAAALSS